MRSEIRPSPISLSATLREIYALLLKEYGSQNWWPADSSFEVMLGAILTQNTNWRNVEKALANLKVLVSMAPEAVLALPETRLQEAIRPSGYYRQKADRLRTLCAFLIEEYSGDLSLTARSPIQELRQKFLALSGIGPETADSILLYALDRPVFVVDAYTVRLFSRMGLCNDKERYETVQSLFMDNLEHDAQLFNEYHALIVRHCKLRCTKRKPECRGCDLNAICTYYLRSQISGLR